MGTTVPTMDLDAMLGEMDDDLEFFQGLFDDVPAPDNAGEDLFKTDEVPATTLAHPPLILDASTSSDRRRQRWLALGDGTPGLPTRYSWREIAKTQKHARQAAEDENAQLRKLIKAHTRAVQKMMQLTSKASTALSLCETVEVAGVRYLGPPADMAVITRSLDTLANEAEEALRSSLARFDGAQPQVCVLQNRILNIPAGDAVETTVELSLLLPFDVEAITGAMVAHSIRLVTRKQIDRCVTMYESPDFKVVQGVSKAKEMNGVRITKHGQLATRREPLRSNGSRVVVMESTGDFYMEETRVVAIAGESIIHVSPMPGHNSAALGPLSRIRWLRRFRAQPTSASDMTPADRARWISAFTANSARKTERQVDKITQSLENCLLGPTTSPNE